MKTFPFSSNNYKITSNVYYANVNKNVFVIRKKSDIFT